MNANMVDDVIAKLDEASAGQLDQRSLRESVDIGSGSMMPSESVVLSAAAVAGGLGTAVIGRLASSRHPGRDFAIGAVGAVAYILYAQLRPAWQLKRARSEEEHAKK